MSDQPPGWGSQPPPPDQSAFGSVPPSGQYPSGQYGPPPAGQYGPPQQPWGAPPSGANDNLWILGAHLGLFLGFWIIAPLVVMLSEGTKNPRVRENAVEALNFQITLAIAAFVSFVLTFVVIGAFMLIAVVLAAFVLPIVAAVKSAEEPPYRYPMTLRLVK